MEAVGLKESTTSCAMTDSKGSPAWSSSELGRRGGGEFLPSGAWSPSTRLNIARTSSRALQCLCSSL
eukprot:7443760-Pyramimonas_sp.AAC.1